MKCKKLVKLNVRRIGAQLLWFVLFSVLITDSAAAQSQILLPLLVYTPPDCTVVVPACNLTDSLEAGSAPAWSPDSNKIAFVRHASTLESVPYSGIYVIDASGGRPVLLAAQSYEPAWSPDGTKIAFTRGGLYIMNADGSQPTEVGQETNRTQAIAWSPDGTKIAFQSFTPVDDCCDFAGALYVVNVDGSQRTMLAQDVTLTRPSWSPDGKKITAGVYNSDGSTDIYVIDADGSSRTNLTHDPLYNSAAVWSPDGSKIAFASGEPSGGWHLYVMNSDGSNMIKLTRKPTLIDSFDTPMWSPDSSKLLYLTILPSTTDHLGIYLLDAAGGQERQLIYSAQGSTWGGQPAWSPDGSKIAFSNVPDIYILGMQNLVAYGSSDN